MSFRGVGSGNFGQQEGFGFVEARQRIRKRICGRDEEAKISSSGIHQAFGQGLKVTFFFTLDLFVSC